MSTEELEKEQEIENQLPTDEGENTEPIEGQEEQEEDIYSTISKISGISIEDQFEDSVEGYAKREVKVYEKGKQDALQILKEQHPDIYDLLEYKQAGGNPIDLLSKKQVNTMEPQTDSEFVDIITSYLQQMGLEKEDIQRNIENWEDIGMLENKAKQFQAKMKEDADKQWGKQLEEQRQKKVYYEQEINKTASHISSQIEKGEAGRFIISQPDKDAFKDAFLNSVIAQPDEDGTIRYYYTREINPNDIQADLMAEYLRFKKGNLQDIVAKQVKTEQARTLRKSTQSNNKKTNDRADDIMLSALFKTL